MEEAAAGRALQRRDNIAETIEQSIAEHMQEDKLSALKGELEDKLQRVKASHQVANHRQQTLQKDTTGHRDIEEALRKAKCKLAVEVKSTNEKYDQDMLAISSDIDNMQDAYSREQKEVRELSEHFVKMKSKRVLKRKNIVGGNSRRGMQSSAR
ncbi:hypothetical protein Ae201684_006445 [Aphanomyces euteiches]|uniref:Dynein regulatory complex protein 10 n=1 Tax=Aphanomyces euteiches TaxID=100861 RepID=A0A6G0XAY3_9STRA|nr:hypothetical protein Ae201684_006445 [Aphanomyces euteiches]